MQRSVAADLLSTQERVPKKIKHTHRLAKNDYSRCHCVSA